MSDLDEAVFGHASVTSSRGVITCGGRGMVDKSLSKCVIQYNGENRSFPSMVEKRESFGMLNINETLYSIGGWNNLNGNRPTMETMSNTMETINLNDGKEWTLEKIPFYMSV